MPRSIAMTSLALLATLAACATTSRQKPVITARVASRIAAKCGAMQGAVHRNKNASLPSVDFVTRDEDSASEGQTPTVRCIGVALQPYRYSFFGFGSSTVP